MAVPYLANMSWAARLRRECAALNAVYGGTLYGSGDLRLERLYAALSVILT